LINHLLEYVKKKIWSKLFDKIYPKKYCIAQGTFYKDEKSKLPLGLVEVKFKQQKSTQKDVQS